MTKRKAGRRKLGQSKAADRHTTPREAFHLMPELQEALEDFAKNADPPADKSAVLRSALEEYLRNRSKWPPRS